MGKCLRNVSIIKTFTVRSRISNINFIGIINIFFFFFFWKRTLRIKETNYLQLYQLPIVHCNLRLSASPLEYAYLAEDKFKTSTYSAGHILYTIERDLRISFPHDIFHFLAFPLKIMCHSCTHLSPISI